MRIFVPVRLVVLAPALLLWGCLFEPIYIPPRPRSAPPPVRVPERAEPTSVPEPSRRSGDRALDVLYGEIEYYDGIDADSPRVASLQLTAEAWDLVRAGNQREAFELLERAVAIDGTSGFAYLFLARLHRDTGDYNLSQAFLSRARPLLPADPELDIALDDFDAELRGHVSMQNTGG